MKKRSKSSIPPPPPPPRKPRRPRGPANRHIDRELLTPQQTAAAGEAMYVAMGGREGVLAVLDGLPEEDTKASTLRNLLMTPAAVDKKVSFAKMRAKAGYSAKDVFELFNDRQHATALVVAAAAKPRMVEELIGAASVKRVPCDLCGTTKRIAILDEDGEWESWQECVACDAQGLVEVDGNQKARELYFGTFVRDAQGPLVAVVNDNRQDNRSVNFQVGMQGTAPSPLSMIRALDKVSDVGPKMLNAAPTAAPVITVIAREVEEGVKV